MKTLTLSPMLNSFEVLTVAEERAEWVPAVKQIARLRRERPQSDFKGGWLRQWTLVSDFYDKRGFNRKDSTFTLWGLKELGIIKEII